MDFQNGFPEKDGEYLVLMRVFEHHYFYRIVNFSNDLYSVDKYDFSEYRRKRHKGWYDYSSEWGYYGVDEKDIVGWAELPEISEVLKMDGLNV